MAIRSRLWKLQGGAKSSRRSKWTARFFSAFALLCFSASAAKKPSQPDVAKGCVSVTEIHSHPFGALSVLEGLDATVRNACDKSAIVTIAIGYFDKKGTQFGSAFELPTVGAGASFYVRHVTTLDWLTKGRLKSVRVLAVTVTTLP